MSAFEFADSLGPEKVVEIYDPDVDLRAAVVVDNVAAGPAIGGVRMAADATVEECFRLARAMTGVIKASITPPRSSMPPSASASSASINVQLMLAMPPRPISDLMI